jgi:hypothetical protein
VSEHRWLIALEGRNVDLLHLAEMFPAGSAVVLREDGSYYLAADDIDALNTISDVLDQADKWLTMLNGIARWRSSRIQPICLGDPTEIKKDGSRERTRTLAARIVVAIDGRATLTVGLGAGGPAEPVVPITERAKILAAGDPVVARVLRLYSRPDLDWVNLYRIYDAVEEEVGNEHMVRQNGWASGNRIERFTRTANSREAVGDEARHGRSVGDPPPNPMTLLEGIDFVKHIVECWIRSKAT